MCKKFSTAELLNRIISPTLPLSTPSVSLKRQEQNQLHRSMKYASGRGAPIFARRISSLRVAFVQWGIFEERIAVLNGIPKIERSRD